MHFDVAIIGGGPGGYVAAIKAAQNGLKTCVIEWNKLGGTCLNVGCIPTKALLTTTKKYDNVLKLMDKGVVEGQIRPVYENAVAEKDKAVAKLVGGVGYLMKKNGVTVIEGTASFKDKNTLSVSGLDEPISFENAIIASGSVPNIPQGLEYDGRFVCTSDEALSWEKVPESLIIVGGGVISCEMASIFALFGSKVTIVEILDSILPGIDAEIRRSIRSSLEQLGVEILVSKRILRLSSADGVVEAKLQDGRKLTAQRALITTGRKANIKELALDSVGIRILNEKIEVDLGMRTNIDEIYAIGDVCCSPYDLAHTAMKEAETAVGNILGSNKKMRYDGVPQCIYTVPEAAVVGADEQKLRADNEDINIGRFYFRGNGRAVSADETQGYIKIITDAKSGKVKGAQMYGSHVTELTAIHSAAIHLGLTAKELTEVMFAHPTLSEAVFEAAADTEGIAIHI